MNHIIFIEPNYRVPFYKTLFLFFQIIEEEASKRIELLVKKRVEEELEKRKDEIENEVARRVEAAKKQMEFELMQELEKRREQAREEERKREVRMTLGRIGAMFWSKTSLNEMMILFLFVYQQHKNTKIPPY